MLIFNFIISITRLVLIGSSWNLQIRWTCVSFWTNSRTGKIRLFIFEVGPLDSWYCFFFFDLIISITPSVFIRSSWILQTRSGWNWGTVRPWGDTAHFFFLAICFKDTIHHVLIEYSLIIKDFSDMTGFLDNSFYNYTPQRLFKYDFISD